MDAKHYLSPQDVEALKKLAGGVQKNPGRLAHDEAQAEECSNEMLIAVPPCGKGIPARSGTTPGSNYCCLFKLVATTPSSGVTGFNFKLLPLSEPGSGNPVRANVYNIYDQAIGPYQPPNEKYIQVKKDKYGKYLAVAPALFSAAATTTTPASGISVQTCTGNCKWTWNGTCWTTDGCTTSSTTSTTTTTSSSTTTSTTTTCLCSGTPASTSTTTTTPCSFCSYPPFCGTTVGQCYFATCVETDPGEYSSCSCSTTTTPSCNCNTTSTAGPCLTPPCGGQGDNCGGNCVWHYSGTSWNLAYQGCVHCVPPPDGTDTCSAYVSYCNPAEIFDFIMVFPGFGGGSGGPCSNSPLPPKCCWCYWTAINDWVLDNGGCCAGGIALGPYVCHHDAFGVAYCTGGWACPKPSFIPDMGTDTCNQGCSIPFTTDLVPYCSLYPGADCNCNCSNGTGPTTTSPIPGTTTTTAAPGSNACTCGYCYTTTTSAPVDQGYCLWQCSSPGGAWSSLVNNCAASYNCAAPPENCLESCQTQISACTSTTTTT